jgi:endonuclease YncB( thermonuclease family)
MPLILIVLAAQVALSGVAHVVDGDTLTVGGTKVRLSGIDAPELAQRCGVAHRQDCGAMAASWLRARVEGRRVDCTIVDRDRYERAVAVCKSNGVDVGAAIVEAGWATAYRRYSRVYVSAENRAKAARHGIWQEGLERPEDYRRSRRRPDPAPSDPACRIKGNISSSGVRIYHVPGSRAYPDVRIDEQKGERWFCSAANAERAGWRRPAR